MTNHEAKISGGKEALEEAAEKPSKSVEQSQANGWDSLRRRLHERLASDNLLAALTRGASGAFAVKVTGAGLGFGVHILLARLLGVTHYGLYIYAYTWIGVLVLVGRMGMDKGFLRFIPEYRANQQWGRLRGILRFGFRTTLAASVTVALLASLVIWFLRDAMPPGQAETFWVALGLIPLWSLLWLCKGALRGLKSVVRALAPEQVIRHVLLAAGAFVLYLLLGEHLTAPAAMGVTLAAMALSLLVAIYFFIRAIPSEVQAVPVQSTQHYWFRIAVPMVFISGMHVVMSKTDIAMIGALVGPEATGIYGAVTRVASLVVFGLSAVNIIAAPMISELFHTGQKDQLSRMVTWAARGTFALATVLALLLVAFGAEVLSLFGSEFRAGYPALLVLLAGQLTNAFAGSVGFIMTMTGHQDQAAYILGICALANIGLNAILVPLFGMMGGAAATAATLMLWNVWMIYYVIQKMGINPTIFRRSREVQSAYSNE